MADEPKIIGSKEAEDNIVFMNAQGEEILKVSPDGFFIRGRPVEVEDPAEHDRVVYQTLKHLMLGVTASPVRQDDPQGFDALIEAFTIFRKYGNPGWPTHCDHDVMLVLIDPELVSEEDKARLDKLGFFVGEEWPDSFTSFRFGNA